MPGSARSDSRKFRGGGNTVRVPLTGSTSLFDRERARYVDSLKGMAANRPTVIPNHQIREELLEAGNVSVDCRLVVDWTRK